MNNVSGLRENKGSLHLREGEVLYLHPAKSPVPGCDILVGLQVDNGPEALARRGQGLLFLDPFIKIAPGAGGELLLDHVLQILRILSHRELVEG